MKALIKTSFKRFFYGNVSQHSRPTGRKLATRFNPERIFKKCLKHLPDLAKSHGVPFFLNRAFKITHILRPLAHSHPACRFNKHLTSYKIKQIAMKKSSIILTLFMIAVTACKKSDPPTAIYQVNNTTSKIGWKGSATDHFHVGAFDVNGTINTTGGVVKGGDFTIPILSIVDYDLADPARGKLLDDLKSINFFNVALHPETTFHITSATPFAGVDTSAVAGANYLLTGDFTMIGETHAISFPANIMLTTDSLKTEAKFKLDRTKWGMNIYNDPTQALYIYPDVNINLHISAAIAR
jgi:polyisoprenoid-binding protein YceI